MKIEMHSLVSAYAKKIYVVWNQNEYFDRYELYRNGVLIGETDEKGFGPFERPTVFDADHHTNLFKKDSLHQLMYVDENIKPFVEYQYQLKAYRGVDNVFESEILYSLMS